MHVDLMILKSSMEALLELEEVCFWDRRLEYKGGDITGLL